MRSRCTCSNLHQQVIRCIRPQRQVTWILAQITGMNHLKVWIKAGLEPRGEILVQQVARRLQAIFSSVN